MYETSFHSQDFSSKKFLVTGGAGFIGSNLVEYLLAHNAKKIVILDNLSTGSQQNIDIVLQSIPEEKRRSIQFIKGDICTLDDCHKACEGIDYVFHQAALGSVPRSIKNPLATHLVNATGFINLLIAARDAKVKRTVYASSSSVYGDSTQLPKVEEIIGKPLSPYAFGMKNESGLPFQKFRMNCMEKFLPKRIRWKSSDCVTSIFLVQDKIPKENMQPLFHYSLTHY